jgi:hypothetical protein
MCIEIVLSYGKHLAELGGLGSRNLCLIWNFFALFNLFPRVSPTMPVLVGLNDDLVCYALALVCRDVRWI